jgi:hypothetical protein
MWKSAGRDPSLRVLPWHLPYKWGKITENLRQGKKNLSQNTVYILPKQPHITKPTHTQTHITKQYETITVQMKNKHSARYT